MKGTPAQMTGKSTNSADTGATPTPTLATLLSSLNWGGSAYPSYEGRNDVSAPSAADGGAGAAAPTSAAADGGTGTPSAASASPAEGQTPTASPAGTPAGGNDDNIRQLRQNYETLKPWEKVAQTVKDPAQAVAAYNRVQSMHSEASRLAQSLGYTAESLEAAFNDDPIDTLQHLRSEYGKTNPNYANEQAVRRAAAEAARQATAPVTQEIHRQKTEQAMTRITGEFERLVNDEQLGFGKDTPKDIRDAVYDVMDMLMPESVLKEVYTSGKVSGVQQYFNEAKNTLVKVVNAYNAMLAKRAQSAGGGGNGNGQPPARPVAGQKQAPAANKLTLDDILNDPGVLPGIKSNAY